YPVHYIGTGPGIGANVQGIAANAGDRLRFAQRFLALAQFQLSFNVFGQIRGDAEDAENLAVRAIDRVFAIVDPTFRSNLRRQLLDLVHAPALGDGPILKPVTYIGDLFRVNVAIGFPDQLRGIFCGLSQTRQVPARGKEDMVAILDIDVVAGVLDQSLETRRQGRV